MVRAKVVTVMIWCMPDEVNQKESEQNEVDGTKKGADSAGKMMHIWKSSWWFVMRKMQMVELGWQQMGSGLYNTCALNRDYVGSQVGQLWEFCSWVRGVYIQCVQSFINLEPVQTAEIWGWVWHRRSFNHGTCKTFLNLLEARKIVVKRD